MYYDYTPKNKQKNGDASEMEAETEAETEEVRLLKPWVWRRASPVSVLLFEGHLGGSSRK